MIAVKKQTLLVDTDFWKQPEDLEDREDYRFFREEFGFMRKAGCKLNDNLCWTDNIAFQFPTHQQQIPPDSLHNIRQLLPHAAKSIELWRTFSILKSRYQAVLAALDHVRVGLCIAEPGGSIIVANEEAQRIFSLGRALRLGDDKHIHCQSKSNEMSIQHSIMKSCATSSGQGSVADALEIVTGTNEPQISIEVAPLRDSGAEIASHFNGALITLIDMSSKLKIDSSKIAIAYKLSPTEKNVCQLLVSGVSVNDIAETRNVTPETIKSQLKSIYRKTQCKSRLELTRLAVKADPPIE